jgi:hypothetical protein
MIDATLKKTPAIPCRQENSARSHLATIPSCVAQPSTNSDPAPTSIAVTDVPRAALVRVRDSFSVAAAGWVAGDRHANPRPPIGRERLPWPLSDPGHHHGQRERESAADEAPLDDPMRVFGGKQSFEHDAGLDRRV